MRKPVVDQNQLRLIPARGRAAAVALTVRVGMLVTDAGSPLA
jgi:hypothetical protein